jgi:uncharacterized protein
MNRLKLFSIPFTSLKNGKHSFDFKIEDSFFTDFEYSPIKKADISVDLEFNKQETMFVLDFVLKGDIELTCDRCNEEFRSPFHTNERLIFKFGEESEEQTEEIIILSRAEHEINLSSHLYEFIVVGIPLIHVHSGKEDGSSGCNPETLEILKKLSISEEDSSEKEEGPETIIDPRWEALKKLRDN